MAANGECKKPLLIVISAPSGAGKTTLCDRLLLENNDMIYSVSCTTREPRGEEVDGEDYYFLSEEQFSDKVKKGFFLEYATVHGKRYGTLKETVYGAMSEGHSILMDIDVQGARQIRDALQRAPDGDMIKSGFVDIFIQPPSIQDLRARIEGRGEDSPDAIELRIKNAQKEMDSAGEFRYIVVNDELEIAYRALLDIINNVRD